MVFILGYFVLGTLFMLWASWLLERNLTTQEMYISVSLWPLVILMMLYFAFEHVHQIYQDSKRRKKK